MSTVELPKPVSAQPTSDSPEQWVNKTLCGTYYLEALLGSGGMGAVFRARHLRTGGACAVKILHRQHRPEDEAFLRFQTEARVVAALNHPNIAKVFDFDRDIDAGFPFLVMELLKGEDLQSRLEKRRQLPEKERPLPLSQVLDLAKQCCAALTEAEKLGVVHRDIKPGNIFLVPGQGPDGQDLVKLVDFGIAKIRRTAPLQLNEPNPKEKPAASGLTLLSKTKEGTVLGTPLYMAPEAVLGQTLKMDGRMDQWSLGVVLYELLAGRHPFVAENETDTTGLLFSRILYEEPPLLAKLRPDLPPHVLAAISRAMNKKADDRFASMSDFARMLMGEQQKGTPKVRFWTIAALGSAVAALLVGAIFGGVRVLPKKAQPSIGTPSPAALLDLAESPTTPDLSVFGVPDLKTQDLAEPRTVFDLSIVDKPTTQTALPMGIVQKKPKFPKAGKTQKPGPQDQKTPKEPPIDENLFNPE